jgi:hypothetical protein
MNPKPDGDRIEFEEGMVENRQLESKTARDFQLVPQPVAELRYSKGGRLAKRRNLLARGKNG